MREELNVDTRTVNVISICSGLGGMELGLDAALDGRTRTVCYVENELGVASILAARIEDGTLAPAPIWSDLRTFDPEPWRGKVALLAGGFPCQPHSVAGSQLGEDDPRELSGEVLRIAAGLGYPALFLENVPGILRFYWDSIRPELREMGYEVTEGLFSAAETGAPHKRERLFILAHAQRYGDICGEDEKGHELQSRDRGGSPQHLSGTVISEVADAGHTERQGRIKGEEGGEGGTCGEPAPQGSELAHAEREGLEGGTRSRADREGGASVQFTAHNNELAHADNSGSRENIQPPELRTAGTEQPPSDSWKTESREDVEVEGWGDGDINEPGLPLYPPGPYDHAGWAYMLSIMPEAQPTFCRVVDGAPTGVERRLRALGNGVVPAVAAKAFRELSKTII